MSHRTKRQRLPSDGTQRTLHSFWDVRNTKSQPSKPAPHAPIGIPCTRAQHVSPDGDSRLQQDAVTALDQDVKAAASSWLSSAPLATSGPALPTTPHPASTECSPGRDGPAAPAPSSEQQQQQQQQQQQRSSAHPAGRTVHDALLAGQQRRRADPEVGTVHLTDGRSSASRPLHLSELPGLAPLQLVQRFLPAAEADELLVQMLQSSAEVPWRAGKWTANQVAYDAPRLSALVMLRPKPTCTTLGGGAGSRATSIAARSAGGYGARDESGDVGLPTLEGSRLCQVVADRIMRLVNSEWPAEHKWLLACQHSRELRLQQQQGVAQPRQGLRPEPLAGQAAHAAAPSPEQLGWYCDYALANLYDGGQNKVGKHSDSLTLYGPLPAIASLSLGAMRVFRLHPAASRAPTASPSTTCGGGSSGGGGSCGGGGAQVPLMWPTRIDLQLRHNDLLIMWPPCQEEWVHEVPVAARQGPLMGRHPLAGLVRVNLTFRAQSGGWAARAPLCWCRRPAVLKALERAHG